MKTITKFLTLVLSLFCVFGLVSPVYAEGEDTNSSTENNVTVELKNGNSVVYSVSDDYYFIETGYTYFFDITDPTFAGLKFDTQTAAEKDGFFKWYGGGADYDKYGFGIEPLKTGETTVEYYPGMYKHVYVSEDALESAQLIESEFLNLAKDYSVASSDEDATEALNALMVQAIQKTNIPTEYVRYEVGKESDFELKENEYYYAINLGVAGLDAAVTVTVDPTKKATSNTEVTDVTASSSVDASTVVKNAMNNNVFTEEQVAAINDGADTEVKTVIGKIESTAEDKSLVEAQLNSTNKIAMYLDLKVVASVTKDGNKVGEDVTVSETGTPVKFTVALDDSLINTKNTVDRTYQVVRIHNGVVDVLPATFDADSKTITFETDKFSTYALMYTDTPKASKTPATADGMNVTVYGGVAVISVLTVGLLFFFKKRNA